jgi:hypothetical protein
MLAAGEWRPCCDSIVSLDLHQALQNPASARARVGHLGESLNRRYHPARRSVPNSRSHTSV